MAAFTASGRIEQSADGKTEVFVDTSNYTDNTDGVTLNNIQGRTVTSYLADNSGYYNQVMVPANLTLNVPVVKDLDLKFEFVVTLANNSTRQATITYLSTRFYDIIQRQKANKLNCGCACKELCTDMTKAREFVNAAVTSHLVGDRVSAQADMDSANIYINSSDCGC